MAYQNTRQSSNKYALLDDGIGESMEGIQIRGTVPGTPKVTLGSEAFNTPNHTDAYSDGFMVSSPTQRIVGNSQINLNSSPPKPPTKRHRVMAPDTGFSSAYFGTPQTTQEAIKQARNLLCQAVGLSKDPVEQANLFKLGAIFEDFVNGQPTNRTVEALKATADKLEKATKSFPTPQKQHLRHPKQPSKSAFH
jgi:hypothetical protein